MPRVLATSFLLCLAAAVLAAPAARAEDKPREAHAVPALASDEEAAQVLEVFKEDWKAKGLKGDERISQRDFAMRKIAGVQHPDVVEALGKASRDGDPDVRMIALIYLGDQRALPHLAAQHVLKAMRKYKKDVVLVLTGLQSLGQLKYLGAREDLRDMITHRLFVVRKAAIACVGRIGDKRMLKDVLAALGMKVDDSGKDSSKQDKESGGKEVVEEGYSWDGVEVTYDTGAPDDSDQKMAEKIGKEQLAKNKAEAESAAGRSSGGGINAGGGAGSVSGGGGGRGGSARSTEELIPTILRTLKALTGEEFDKPSTIRKWLLEHQEEFAKDRKALDEQEQAQKDAAK